VLKLVAFLVGALFGALGAVSWLLGEPGTGSRGLAAPGTLGMRVQEIEARFRTALAEGERAGREKEEQLQQRLASYRKSPDLHRAS
jgi:hypothetical protein